MPHLQRHWPQNRLKLMFRLWCDVVAGPPLSPTRPIKCFICAIIQWLLAIFDQAYQFLLPIICACALPFPMPNLRDWANETNNDPSRLHSVASQCEYDLWLFVICVNDAFVAPTHIYISHHNFVCFPCDTLVLHKSIQPISGLNIPIWFMCVWPVCRPTFATSLNVIWFDLSQARSRIADCYPFNSTTKLLLRFINYGDKYESDETTMSQDASQMLWIASEIVNIHYGYCAHDTLWFMPMKNFIK